ncbi:MAG: DUF3943 domain-containing protein [Thermodesulfobacteriota bacterium]
MSRLVKYSIVITFICSSFLELRAYGNDYTAFLFPENYGNKISHTEEKSGPVEQVTGETPSTDKNNNANNPVLIKSEKSFEYMNPDRMNRIENLIISPNDINESYSIPLSELISNFIGKKPYKFDSRIGEERGYSIRYIPQNEIRAFGFEEQKRTLYSDIYGDTTVLLMYHLDSIDLTKKKVPSKYYVTREKNITSDFNDFAKASIIPYAWNWTERVIIAPDNVSNVYRNSPSGYFDNIISWQGCKKDFCGNNSIRASFWSFPYSDGDNLNTNYFQHPLSGMSTYLYYRSVGFDKVTSGVGSAMHSILFEYTVEAWQQPPSLNDIIVTPLIGVPVGIMVEYFSNYLLQTDSQFLRAVGYMINPFNIFIPNGDIHWHRLIGFTFKFNSF